MKSNTHVTSGNETIINVFVLKFEVTNCIFKKTCILELPNDFNSNESRFIKIYRSDVSEKDQKGPSELYVILKSEAVPVTNVAKKGKKDMQ